VGAALAVLPGTSEGGKLGDLVAKDIGKGASPVAVALATVQKPGQMTAVITSNPRHRVAWNYTTDCFKGLAYSQWPPPGQSEDIESMTPVRKKLKTGGLKDPDYCLVAVSGKLDFKSAKSVTAKIFAK